MLSSLLRPDRARRLDQEHSPFSSPFVDRSSPAFARQQRRIGRAPADYSETEEEEFTEDGDGDNAEEEESHDDDGLEPGDEDGDEDTPLLPLFSAAHLDALPVYNLTHAIRLIVLPRAETTLTWDQLRSPQVSQFLVKPMQQQIRTSYFSRATLYALMANSLQFQKESQASPGNAGSSRTRAMVCELLAIKLLKEYDTRELIDALSYDFFPLQGLNNHNRPSQLVDNKVGKPAAARISALEIAIRASAKHFLAHPLVVQHLEAIWAGTIVFHSAADNLHRPAAYKAARGKKQGHGTTAAVSSDDIEPQKQLSGGSRRTVTIYDPRDASLFKLSRLRVPRYRQFFSTCSLAILLVLFVAVLSQRSNRITSLEFLFWFWSAGFMLEEVVGFSEQGFSLYISSLWNIFDLGILLLLFIYYCMRLYGTFLVDKGRREYNSMAYDVLATNAILLFPRLFSVLDHYRYFSQLLIAFRLMAVDLIAVFVLIIIACSGFFVAFTLSFGENEYDAAGVAYKIFQMLMGFTPAAWEAWPTYNPLGRALLALFLFLTHFLIVTILVTVLTNSFMAIVSNANEEHQFVFAVNTLSLVKSEALFSYVAPTNIFAWILTPLRLCLPFRKFVKLNRTVIKLTHFPLLLGIFGYEKVFLLRSIYEPTDLIDHTGRGRKPLISFHDGRSGLFNPSLRMRHSSAAAYQKDKALDEVFRLAPRSKITRNNGKSLERGTTYSVVNNWMDHQDGMASSPPHDRSVVGQLDLSARRRKPSTVRQRAKSRAIPGSRSAASDPADFMSTKELRDDIPQDIGLPPMVKLNDALQMDDDGDDEAATNDDSDDGTSLVKPSPSGPVEPSDKGSDNGYFYTPSSARADLPRKKSTSSASMRQDPSNSFKKKTSPPKRRPHNRNFSTNTILFNPISTSQRSSSFTPNDNPPSTISKRHTPPDRPGSGSGPRLGHRTPRHSIYTTANTKPRPILPARHDFQSVPNFNLDTRLNLSSSPAARHLPRRRRSSLDLGPSMSELNFDDTKDPLLGAVPSSFATQMALATGGLRGFNVRSGRAEEASEAMMGRLMLARMKTLEETFAEVAREFRDLRTAGNSSVEGGEGGRGAEPGGGMAKGLRPGMGMVKSSSEVDVRRKGRGRR